MKKRFLALLLGVVFSVTLLLGAEGLFVLNEKFGFFNRPSHKDPFYGVDSELSKFVEDKYNQSPWAKTETPHFWEVERRGPRGAKLDSSLKYGSADERQGLHLTKFLIRPYARYRSIMKLENSDRVIYDVTIDMTERSRRAVVPENTSSDQGVLFFGDSNTFGEGVFSHETYVSQFAKLNPQYQVLNFGIGGSAPNVFLEEIERTPQYRYVNLKVPAKNIGIYLIIDDTLERMICRLSCLRENRKWILQRPFYKLNAEGVPVYQGSFADSRKTLNAVYSVFANSALLNFFRIDYPPYWRQGDMDFMAKVLQVYLEKLKKHMNVDRFVVFSFPGSRMDPEMLKTAFAGVGIEFWDFSKVDFTRITQGKDAYPWDYHPTPLGHYLLAELLTHQLHKTNPGR